MTKSPDEQPTAYDPRPPTPASGTPKDPHPRRDPTNDVPDRPRTASIDDSGGADDRPHTRTPDDTAKKPNRTKLPPPRSLVELYSSKSPNAKAFLRELETGSSWKFADEDVEAALALLPEHDPQLAITRQLVHEAIGAYGGRFSPAAADFALRALSVDFAGLDVSLLDDGQQPTAALAELARRLEKALEQPRMQRRAHNALMIGLDVLSARRGMSIEDAAPVLAEAVGPPAAYKRNKSNPRRHRVRTIALPKNDLARVRDLLDLLGPWQEAADNATRREIETDARAREAIDAATAAEERAAELAADLSEVRSKLDEQTSAAQDALSEVRDVRIHAAADFTELRSRSAAFLNSRLASLLATAKEASEARPPSPDAAAQLLDQAIKELQREVEWLKSSG